MAKKDKDDPPPGTKVDHVKGKPKDTEKPKKPRTGKPRLSWWTK